MKLIAALTRWLCSESNLPFLTRAKRNFMMAAKNTKIVLSAFGVFFYFVMLYAAFR